MSWDRFVIKACLVGALLGVLATTAVALDEGAGAPADGDVYLVTTLSDPRVLREALPETFDPPPGVSYAALDGPGRVYLLDEATLSRRRDGLAPLAHATLAIRLPAS